IRPDRRSPKAPPVRGVSGRPAVDTSGMVRRPCHNAWVDQATTGSSREDGWFCLRPSPVPRPHWKRWLAMALLGGYLLFCHGCHGDEDDELLAGLSLQRGRSPMVSRTTTVVSVVEDGHIPKANDAIRASRSQRLPLRR